MPQETVRKVEHSTDGPVDSNTATTMKTSQSSFTIFFLALLFAGVGSFLSAVEPIVASSSTLLVAAVNFLGGASPLIILSYLAYPLLFFLALYYVGMGLDLGKQYVAAGFSLFFGGISGVLLGSLAGFYLLHLLLPSANSESATQQVTGIGPVFGGLFAFFVGFSALSLAHLKTEGHQDGKIQGNIIVLNRALQEIFLERNTLMTPANVLAIRRKMPSADGITANSIAVPTTVSPTP